VTGLNLEDVRPLLTSSAHRNTFAQEAPTLILAYLLVAGRAVQMPCSLVGAENGQPDLDDTLLCERLVERGKDREPITLPSSTARDRYLLEESSARWQIVDRPDPEPTDGGSARLDCRPQSVAPCSSLAMLTLQERREFGTGRSAAPERGQPASRTCWSAWSAISASKKASASSAASGISVTSAMRIVAVVAGSERGGPLHRSPVRLAASLFPYAAFKPH